MHYKYILLSCGIIHIVGGSCANGEVRLISQYSYGRSEGRVEVCHNQQWGTICRDNWGDNNTRVVCDQLGYNGEYGYTIPYYSFGSTSNPIVYNDVDCVRDETNIASCSKSTDTTGCSHSTDIAVRCFCKCNTHHIYIYIYIYIVMYLL